MRSIRHLTYRRCDYRVKKFNERFKIGQAVEVRFNSGKVIKSKTASEAKHYGYNSAVVWVEGIAGSVDLSDVFPIEE